MVEVYRAMFVHPVNDIMILFFKVGKHAFVVDYRAAARKDVEKWSRIEALY